MISIFRGKLSPTTRFRNKVDRQKTLRIRSAEFTRNRAMQKNINASYIAGAILSMLSAMLIGCVYAPQNGRNAPVMGGARSGSTPIQRTAFSGIPQSLGYFHQLNADCSSLGLPIVMVTQAASHGSVLIQNDVESYPNYPVTNQRYECNKKKTAGVGVVYTSEKIFVGTDRFSLKRVSESGDALTLEYVVTVEQPPKAQPGAAPP